MRFHVDIYDSSCSGRRPHVISDLPLQLLPSSALSSSLWLSLSSRFSLRSSVLSPRAPLLLLWFLLLLLLVVLLLQPLLSLHVMLVVFVLLFFLSYITLTLPPWTSRLLHHYAFPGGARTSITAKTMTLCVLLVARVGSMRGEVPRRHI